VASSRRRKTRWPYAQRRERPELGSIWRERT
jgi:hypothetical protein